MTMDVKVIVFVDDPPAPENCRQVKIFDELGYGPLVDARHKNDYYWLHNNIQSGRLFVQEDQNVFMFEANDLDEEMKFVPDFCILFNEDKVVDEDDWKKIHLFVEQHLTDGIIDATNEQYVSELMGKPVVLKPIEMVREEVPPAIPKVNEHYAFESKYLEFEDIMLYEVRKPFTDLPYTSVTRSYSRKGHLPFFTDLFICPSWGVARADAGFLNYIWKQLNMDGEFDLEALMKEAVEKCLPGEDRLPEPEPEVYRRDIAAVEEILKEKTLKRRKFVPEFIKNKN